MMSVGRHVSKLSGYAPALPTPFRPDGAVDFAAFEQLCELQIRRRDRADRLRHDRRGADAQWG